MISNQLKQELRIIQTERLDTDFQHKSSFRRSHSFPAAQNTDESQPMLLNIPIHEPITLIT